MRSESENSSATKDTMVVVCVSTQAGPTTASAPRTACALVLPATSRSRIAKVSCIESEKEITMMRGVITLRKMFSRKSSQPSAPIAMRMATSGGAAATSMKDTRRKNRMAMRQPAMKPIRL